MRLLTKKNYKILFAICYLLLANLAQAQSEPPPRLFIVSPSPGEVILSDKVRVIVNLPKDLILVNPEERKEHAEGEGHLHLWLDASATHDDAVSITLSDTPEYTYENVFSGLHTLYTEFHRNDHSLYEPLLTAKVEFETAGEELKPAPSAGEDSGVAVGDVRGGLFLPVGKGNTAMALVVVLFVIFILWYIFGRKRH